ncbi:bifunctional homocysteine S-methyltransferase/methylenetetrahydrofolate reductase [Pseudalkalibacillus salsuginis]|uniref:bifunctional homocysteine S-methyltransferase/methylenetetrahydrofolate reductase n=1 Tax=Pseudalkalibacillus salsuginis TaxID=2910972 RepID=UPI001F1BE6BB|nr:bifunctional homocysteine S-methyltransferase/methylenetetrahydrofolate reductase [Pseudalkalibacillus salsuginis]MCF6410313.1 bifunctional homocysteine S-methyltransferase/methylenetetrahydrofolate reductase [Pseudalkalibacillus salsuginis]
MGIVDELKQNKILIGDGAMGTLLHSYGSDRCFEELSLSQSEQIFNIHRAYIDAGADIIQTNTYAANYLKLERYGLQDQVKEINTAAVHLAKKASGNDAYVVGTIGGIRGIKPHMITMDEIKRTFREQLYCLLSENIDGILLETFYDLEELATVLQIARKETSLPIIAQVSLEETSYMQNRTHITEAFDRLENHGADIIGINCRLGPYHMLSTLEEVPLPKHGYLSAYPNASLPSYVDGKLQYESDADYFKECALSFRDQGIRLLGGCCGTTPAHIQAISKELKSLAPVKEKIIKPRQTAKVTVSSTAKPGPAPLHEQVKKRQSIIVELDPPRKLDTTRFMKGAKALQEIGIDAITLADNSLASPRICNTAVGSIVKEKFGLRPLIHIACRDRNLIGLQSHIMGLHTLGIRDILAVTGDPTKVGDFPGASSVYDATSFELIKIIKQFNNGISLSGKELGQKTDFSIGAAFNPNVRHIDKAVQRLEKKIECGADYFISQPVFSEEKLIEIHDAVKHLDVPIYIGIMPLTSSKNADFLHHEVPGIKLSPDVREAMARYKDDPGRASEEGVRIAKSLLDTAIGLFNGIYLVTPFMRYPMTVELVKYARTHHPKHSSWRLQNV